MTDKQSREVLSPQQVHRRQYTWQILMPILAMVTGVLVFTIFSILAIGQPSGINEKWAAIATIVLIIPAILLGLLCLAIILLLSKGVDKLIKALPSYTGYISYLFHRTSAITDRFTNESVSPIIRLKSGWAGIGRLIKLIKPIHKE